MPTNDAPQKPPVATDVEGVDTAPKAEGSQPKSLVDSAVQTAQTRKVRAGVRRLTELLRNESGIPAVVELTAPTDYVLPKDFKVRSFKGLLQCSVARPSLSEARVLSYWSNLQLYEAQKAEFRNAIGAHAIAEAWVGPASDVRLKGRSILPQSMPDFLLKVAAVWGAFVGIAGAWTLLFAQPDTLMNLSNVGQIDAIENKPFEFRLNLTNKGRAESKTILEIVEPSSKLEFQPGYVSVGTGKSETVTVKGTAGQPGTLHFRIRSVTTAGLLLPRRRDELDVPVNVWQRELFRGFSVSQVSAQSTVFQGELSVGETAPMGLECAAVLSRAGYTEFVGVAPAINFDDPERNATPGKEVIKINWTTAPVEPYQRLQLQLFLKPIGLSKPDWNELAPRVKVKCDRKPK